MHTYTHRHTHTVMPCIYVYTHNGMYFNYQTYVKQLSYGQKKSARPNWTQASLVMQSHGNDCCILFLSPDRHQQPLATQMSAEYDLFNQGSAVRYFEDWLGGWKTGLVIFGCVWKWLVPLNPMVLLIIIPMKNGYFIGNIPYFQTNPFCDIILNQLPQVRLNLSTARKARPATKRSTRLTW